MLCDAISMFRMRREATPASVPDCLLGTEKSQHHSFYHTNYVLKKAPFVNNTYLIMTVSATAISRAYSRKFEMTTAVAAE